MASGVGAVGLQLSRQTALPLFSVFNTPQAVKATMEETKSRIQDLSDMLLAFQNGYRDRAVERGYDEDGLQKVRELTEKLTALASDQHHKRVKCRGVLHACSQIESAIENISDDSSGPVEQMRRKVSEGLADAIAQLLREKQDVLSVIQGLGAELPPELSAELAGLAGSATIRQSPLPDDGPGRAELEGDISRLQGKVRDLEEGKKSQAETIASLEREVARLLSEREESQYRSIQDERQAREEQAELWAELEASRAAVVRLTVDGDLHEAQAEVARLTDQVQQAQQRIDTLTAEGARYSGIVAENRVLYDDKEFMRAHIQVLWRQADENRAQVKEAEDSWAAARLELADLQAEADRCARRAEACERLAGEAEERAERAQARLESAREERRGLEASNEKLVRKLKDSLTANRCLASDLEKSRERCEDLRCKVDDARGNVESMLCSLAPSGLELSTPWSRVASSLLLGANIDGAVASGDPVAPLAILASWSADSAAAVVAGSTPDASPASVNALILGMVDIVDRKPLWRDDCSVAHCRLGALQQALVSLPPGARMSQWALTLLDSALTRIGSHEGGAFVVRVGVCQILRLVKARWPAGGTTGLTPEDLGQRLGLISVVQSQLIAAVCFQHELVGLPNPARDYAHLASDAGGRAFAFVVPPRDDGGHPGGLLAIDSEHHAAWWVDVGRVWGDLRKPAILLRAPPSAGTDDIELAGIRSWH